MSATGPPSHRAPQLHRLPAGKRWTAVLERSRTQGLGFNLTHVNKQHVFRVVDPGGPAHRAGIAVGDVVMRVNGHAAAPLSHQDVGL